MRGGGGLTVADGLQLILSPISQFEGVFICDGGLNTFCGRRTSAAESDTKLLDEDLKYQLFIAPAEMGGGRWGDAPGWAWVCAWRAGAGGLAALLHAWVGGWCGGSEIICLLACLWWMSPSILPCLIWTSDNLFLPS